MDLKTIPDDFISNTWTRMAQNPQHIFLVLTKRPRRMLEFVNNIAVPKYGVLPNVWFGCTIVNQQEADEKIPIFLQVPGKKFLSIEPCLSEIKLGGFDGKTYRPWLDSVAWPVLINAVILGGEFLFLHQHLS